MTNVGDGGVQKCQVLKILTIAEKREGGRLLGRESECGKRRSFFDY